VKSPLSSNADLTTLLLAGDTFTPAVFVTDLAGSPPSFLFSTLDSLAISSANSSKLAVKHSSSVVYLVAPAYAVDLLALECNSPSLPSTSDGLFSTPSSFCLSPAFGGSSFGVHVDMDRIGDIFSSKSLGRVGVGVWEVVQR
jgi:hypothetical protein